MLRIKDSIRFVFRQKSEPAMFATAVDFANLLLAGLVVGAMFGVWLSFNPAGLDASSYVTLQQQGIRTLNATMPALGGATVLLTLLAAAISRDDRIRLTLLFAAVGCFIAAALVTRFLNQPINAIVVAWSAAEPPADWTRFRDAWWRWHVLRTFIGIGGLCLVIAASLKDAATTAS
jgi:uncharacterized membrane protein